MPWYVVASFLVLSLNYSIIQSVRDSRPFTDSEEVCESNDCCILAYEISHVICLCPGFSSGTELDSETR